MWSLVHQSTLHAREDRVEFSFRIFFNNKCFLADWSRSLYAFEGTTEMRARAILSTITSTWLLWQIFKRSRHSPEVQKRGAGTESAFASGGTGGYKCLAIGHNCEEQSSRTIAGRRLCQSVSCMNGPANEPPLMFEAPLLYGKTVLEDSGADVNVTSPQLVDKPRSSNAARLSEFALACDTQRISLRVFGWLTLRSGTGRKNLSSPLSTSRSIVGKPISIVGQLGVRHYYYEGNNVSSSLNRTPNHEILHCSLESLYASLYSVLSADARGRCKVLLANFSSGYIPSGRKNISSLKKCMGGTNERVIFEIQKVAYLCHRITAARETVSDLID